jgi:hypothetical protein
VVGKSTFIPLSGAKHMSVPQVKSKEEIIQALSGLAQDDPESAHFRADDLLLEALLLAGMQDVVDTYNEVGDRVGFWYS